jgi:amino acid adenylation domain-containing protein
MLHLDLARTEADLGGFDRSRHGLHRLARPEVIAEPRLYVEAVRELSPIFWDDVSKAWVCTGYQEADAILRDHESFRASRVRDAEALQERGLTEAASISRLLTRQLLFLDPPDHTAIRAALQPAFTRSAVAQRHDGVRAIVDELMAAMPARGSVDVVAALAGPLPTRIASSLLGMPDREAEILECADAYETLLGSLSSLPHVRDLSIIARLERAAALFRDEARRRRGGQGDDLLTTMVNHLAGPEVHGAALDQAIDTIAATCIVLAAGGHQTLTNLVAMVLVRLAEAPDELARVVADPQLIEAAIDEGMRLDGSSQYVARHVARAVDVGGCAMSPGQTVVVLLAAANTDPRQFDEPDRFRLDRRDGRHLGFGVGRHHCIGSLDAVEAARAAVSAFVARYAFAPAPGPDAISWGPHANTRCPARVLMDVEPRVTVEQHPSPRALALTEQDRLALRDTTDLPVSLDGEQLWMDIVARTAERTPEVVALKAGATCVTYEQLDRAADVLAARLRDRGVEPGTAVGLVLGRAVEAYVGALAVGRAGGVLMAADVACPHERLGLMLREARVDVVCTDHASRDTVDRVCHAGTDVIELDVDELLTGPARRPGSSGVRAGDGAYLVFTSGSTGVPKAIVIDHEGLVNLHVAARQHLRVGPGDRVLQWFTPNFDGWHYDLVVGLTLGATLVLAPPAAACLGTALRTVLREEAITVATLTPTAWQTVAADDLPGSLRLAATAGEACTAALVERLAAPQRRVINLYGPAEAAVWSTWHECSPGHGDPPIGRPIVNRRVYLLTAEGRPAPAGELGEIWLGGSGVGRYVRQPRLMLSQFHPDPLPSRPGQLMYATGDLGRRRPDGTIEFAGRADRQVKIRGQRIELEEVELALAAAPGVLQASAAVCDGRLIATVVPSSGTEIDVSAVRAHLAGRVHSGMIPSSLHVATEAAVGATGKLRLAPPPDRERDAAAEAAREHTRLIWKVARIYSACLDVPQASIRLDTDFFTAGGDSLSLAELQTAIERELGVEIDGDAVIAGATPTAVAELIARARASS